MVKLAFEKSVTDNTGELIYRCVLPGDYEVRLSTDGSGQYTWTYHNFFGDMCWSEEIEMPTEEKALMEAQRLLVQVARRMREEQAEIIERYSF